MKTTLVTINANTYSGSHQSNDNYMFLWDIKITCEAASYISNHVFDPGMGLAKASSNDIRGTDLFDLIRAVN